MAASQKIFKVRRQYNKWVANQTLEDYALRFTAKTSRNMSIERVAKTALGATAFLALEGIAAAVTLNYGFSNTVIAMLAVSLVFFITGLPISYYSAKYGLDIDLLTRGAGFGYLGSTITSLIYASFTFIFFAIEAAILASALHALLGIPLPIGYVICAVAVIPIVTHGISAISRFQLGTQSLWVLLQCTALGVVVVNEYQQLDSWMAYAPLQQPGSEGFDILLFGAAASVFFALVAQIGEQVDYLRFMPQKTEQNKRRWWFWLILAGPGWIFIGIIKMLLGSFLAYLALSRGEPFIQATDPTYMYQAVFNYLTHSPSISLVLAALMVIISQMKINVTNAYAGSIAWSNFFSRLTHSHPGRVVWLVFNVTIALILMELGIYRALEAILGLFAIVAVSWLASLAADLMINKPLGLSPSYIEFKRGHLYDINPVGTGSMLLACSLGMLCYLGLFGEVARNLCHFVSLVTCFIAVPLIAWLTGGRFYLARPSVELEPYVIARDGSRRGSVACVICENEFEQEDMSYCPAYSQPICSLCCSLDARCLDTCKPHGRLSQQVASFMRLFLPQRLVRLLNSRLGKFISLLFAINLLNAALLAVIYRQMQPATAGEEMLLGQTLWALFFTLLIASGVISWLFLLANESRLVAQKESNRQTQKLMYEIEAHEKTDRELQQAKELAERANAAKSRYLTGISHELRTPLQSILGYAQLLNEHAETPENHKRGLEIIHRSGQYLTDLIEGLLDVSKIEAGRLDLYRSRVPLPELINQLVNMFSMQARNKGIQFRFEALNTLPQLVMTDEKRLRQILINLLSNAVKYTAHGEVEFTISYRNQVAEFTIRDTGCGIPPDQLQRIFEPFERVRNQDSRHLPGTGLGLTIVKLLTEIMGGDLEVDSTTDEGSCFRVRLMLPWIQAESGDVDEALPVVGYVGYQRRLMLVDDDPILRGMLADLLAPLGFLITEAADAESCLQQLDGQQWDLYLLDVSMPGMNGLQLAKTLRQRGVQVPILMLSADAQEHDREPDEQDAYDDYLVKPISNRALLDKLAEHLQLVWTHREMAVESLVESVAVTNAVLGPQSIWQVPDHPLLHELKACAEMGYSKGVKEVLQQLESTALLAPEVLQRLQQLQQGFQLAQLAQSLEISQS